MQTLFVWSDANGSGLEIARHKVVSAARRAGIVLRQAYAKEGKTLRRQAGGYACAKQFKRLHCACFNGCCEQFAP